MRLSGQGCSPTGPREPGGDRACSDPIVDPGSSGFCECGDEFGNRRVDFGCGHGPFNCKAECAKPTRTECHGGWVSVPARLCPLDVSDAHEDRWETLAAKQPSENPDLCTRAIPKRATGFCSCGLGRRAWLGCDVKFAFWADTRALHARHEGDSELTCSAVCQHESQFECRGWMQTRVSGTE